MGKFFVIEERNALNGNPGIDTFSAINDPSRDISRGRGRNCDRNLASGWYRFTTPGQE